MPINVPTVTIERAGGDAPFEYELGASEAFIPQSVTATFDGSGAAVDFKPVLSLYAQNGALLGRWPTSETVPAGSSAEVSWGPFLRGAGGSSIPTVTVFRATFYAVVNAPGTGQPKQTIVSGVVTPVSWQGYRQTGGGSPGGVVTPATPFTTLTFAEFGDNIVTFQVPWPAGAYDRYLELAISNPSAIGTIVSPRLRGGATPDDDVMTLTAVVSGDPTKPTTITANVFQNSGANKDIAAEMYLSADSGDIVLS